MKSNFSKFVFTLLAGILMMTSSCSSDKDDVQDVSKKVNCTISFAYVENFIGGSLYPNFAKSCSLWVFDESGKLVKTYSESGNKVASLDYSINLDLPEGKYDFVTWFGIEDDDTVSLGSNPPETIEDLSLNLEFDRYVGGTPDPSTFSQRLPFIYNGHLSNVEIKKTGSANTPKNVKINLFRASKDVGVQLEGKDSNNDIKNGKFEFIITNGNNVITWNNIPKATDSFYYYPYNRRNYYIDEGNIYTRLTARFSTFPFTMASDSRLIIIRTTDNKEILNISLIEDALLKEKDDKFEGTDDEYLARKDTITVIVILGEKEDGVEDDEKVSIRLK